MALKRNLIANHLGQGWVALMSLAFIPLYIQYLGVEAFSWIGLFAKLLVSAFQRSMQHLDFESLKFGGVHW